MVLKFKEPIKQQSRMCKRTDLCPEKYLERVWNPAHNKLSLFLSS